MKHIKSTIPINPLHQRFGFTLTEMLVAVGLLLVIMTIFAQIFQIAVTAMTRQKGLANNDQRSRTAFSVIDADLKRMSYRSIHGRGGIVPLVPGLMYNGQHAADEQQGYFYYSENNPNDDGDDILQFTVDATLIETAKGANRYAGQRALPFYGKAARSSHEDLPDWDDGELDDTASSPYAEISYFLRHGTLYRRVMLIRDTAHVMPLGGNLAQRRNLARMRTIDSNNKRRLAQPGSSTSLTVFEDLMESSHYSGNFYAEYDFSAHYGESPYNPGVNVPVFHGSLSNDPTNNWPLGIPHFRFGFSSNTGRPREYATISGSDYFIGRFTHGETSSPLFVYPREFPPAATNPFNRNDFDATMLLNTGKLDIYSGHPNSRQGADILINNVHGFNIEIWDPTANGEFGGFVSLGASNADTFSPTQRRNSVFGPANSANRRWVFDTWHSSTNSEPNSPWPTTSSVYGAPPFLPMEYYPEGIVLPPNVASLSGSGQIYEPYVNRPTWSPTEPDAPGTSSNPIYNGMRIFPSPAASLHYGEAIYWEAQVQNVSGPVVYSGPRTEPNWPQVVNLGQSVADTNTFAPVGGVPPAVQWIARDNRKPIKAIRLTIRFLDTTSQQMRQVTMVHSFNEDGL